jgi:hypothetical protein
VETRRYWNASSLDSNEPMVMSYLTYWHKYNEVSSESVTSSKRESPSSMIVVDEDGCGQQAPVFLFSPIAHIRNPIHLQKYSETDT